MNVRTVAGPVTAALVSALLAGCGSGDESISGTAADALHGQVDAVRAAVAEGRDPAAKAAVARLRESIRNLASSGQLNPEDALVLLAQVDRIATQVDKRATPAPTPTATPTPRPTPTPAGGTGGGGDSGSSDVGEGNGKPKGKGKGKGKGR